MLASLYQIQQNTTRPMLVNAKCAQHYIKTVLENTGAEADRHLGLLRRGRRLSGWHALHGDTTERGWTPCRYSRSSRGSFAARLSGPLELSQLLAGICRRFELGGDVGRAR